MFRPLLSVNPDPGRFVERDDVPEADQPPLSRREIDEHLRRRRLPAGHQMAVGTELLVHEALPRYRADPAPRS